MTSAMTSAVTSAGPTPSQTIGPYFHIGLDFPPPGRLAPHGDTGTVLHGRVLDGEGLPVTDALLEVCDGERLARCHTGDEGRFSFVLATDTGGARHATADAPLDATDDATSDATGDATGGASDAPHVVVVVSARGLLRHLTTRCYLPADARRLAADPVLSRVPESRRPTLLAVEDADVGLRFDIHLQGEQETVFFAPWGR